MTNDLTIKQAVGELKAMKKHIEPYMSVVGVTAYDMAIKALEQQPKTGHWITDVYMFGRGRHTCSNCGKGQEYTTAFCSWCGADMRGEEE